MQAFEPYLTFNGNCREAVEFYQGKLGATVEAMMTWGESPMKDEMCSAGGVDEATAAAAANKIMHASMTLDGKRLMASDCPPGMPYEGMKGISLSLAYDDVGEAERVFQALAEGGQVTMPMQKTFWAETFGMATDRFGTPWMVSGGLEPMS